VIVSVGVLASSPAQADNSCVHAFDAECDEPGIGTGACNAGTDTADCSIPTPAPTPTGPNSCVHAFDAECDEPGIGTGACNAGTDTADCSIPTGPNSCVHAFDNECDHPGVGTGACNAGTDTADCSIPTGPNSCVHAFDNECDEPRIGTGLCSAGTDTRDCRVTTAPNPPRATPTSPGKTPRRPRIQSSQQGTDTQTALNYFGFNAGRVDGQIGSSTRAAIERFQRAAGYAVNGRNLSPDQFGFLSGAYSWATGPLGLSQAAADGPTKLRSYRTFLQNGSVTPRPVTPTPKPVTPVAQAPVAPVAPAPATPPPPPLDPVWFMAINGQTTGPFSRAIMGQKVAEGILTRETVVWTAGQGAWLPANTVPALTQLFTFVPPPPPPAN
jgi:peptidoglycan hydrolase-like protein with peptidoglycan-binding domain